MSKLTFYLLRNVAIFRGLKRKVKNMESKTAPGEIYETKKQTARRLCCEPRTIERWMKMGMPFIRLGSRRTLFIPGKVDAFLAALGK